MACRYGRETDVQAVDSLVKVFGARRGGEQGATAPEEGIDMRDDTLITWEMFDAGSLTVSADVDFDAVILEPQVHPVEVVNE
jgi:hypothetical protein